jgi:ribonuclease HI
VYDIYTDGSTYPTNPGYGGWAAIILHIPTNTKQQHVGQSFDPHTTNNQMELQAAILALKTFDTSQVITLYSDSQYLTRCFTERWYDKWIANNWTRRSKGQVYPVLNKDLWRALLGLNIFHTITWKWIRGHAGIPLNEACDQLAHFQARGAWEISTHNNT